MQGYSSPQIEQVPFPVGPFQFSSLANYSINNYVNILVFHFFEKVDKKHLIMVNVNYQNWPDLAIL